MTTLQRIRVALKGDKNRVPLYLVLAQYIYASMTAGSALFTASAALLATLATQIAALSAAQTQVRLRVAGAVGARDATRDLLVLTLEALRNQVQTLCDGSPEQALALIQAAGMKARAVTRVMKEMLTAAVGAQPGVVKLVAHAALLSTSKRKKTYNWSFSVDGGRTWSMASSTPYAKTTIQGLPSLTVCSFRVNVTVGDDAPGAWSQAVSLCVH